MLTLIRALLQEQSDLGQHCLQMPVVHKLRCKENLGHLPYPDKYLLTSIGFPLTFGTGCGTITVSAILSEDFCAGAGPGTGGVVLLGGDGLEGGAGATSWLQEDSMTSAGLFEPEIIFNA